MVWHSLKMGPINYFVVALLILTPLLSELDQISCSPSLEPDWESRMQDLFESHKKALAKQHASKIRLKSGQLFLPTNIVPLSYQVKIRPILESAEPQDLYTATATVKIAFLCTSPTDSITLHAQTKEFIRIEEKSVKLEVKYSSRKSRSIAIFDHWYDEEDTDFYKIQLSSTMKPGPEYSIYMEFSTNISTNSLSGLYLSNYTDPNTNEIKHLAVTQFEDISARKMFPCLDEPHFKATFEIIISRSAKYNSMSNMPKVNTVPDPDKEGYFLDYYAVTPRMSTYLVAIVVSEFTCIKVPSSLYDKSVEACGPEHMINKGGGNHAAEISAKILKFYDGFWQQPYPLPKMQSVAIPNFEAGAMENYGLNTYRIKALIYYPGVTTEADRYGIESTVAHELAHQNFGNLVTCKTWNQIFLNEGFATFVSYFGVQKISPEFQSVDSGWYTGYFQTALRRDAEPNVHAVVKKDDYFGSFDSISYSKGASIIKMMEHILTWETLHAGLRIYLETFSYNNTEYQNLFETLNTQAEVNKTHPNLASITEIMEPWTLQPGFPLIRVQKGFQKMIYVSQERFRKSPTDKADNETVPELWHCPIFIATSADAEVNVRRRPEFWLTNKEVTKSWVTKFSVYWIIVNVDSSAFMRVLYDESLSAAIQAQLEKNSKVFSPITRAQLIDDAFECGWARYNSIEVALSRTKFLAKEPDASVWSTTFSHFRKIYEMLAEDPIANNNFKNYLAPRVAGALQLIGVEQLPQDKGKIVLHRGSLLSWGTVTEVSSVINYAKKLIEQWTKSPSENPVPIDIRGTIYCAVMIGSTKKEFSFVFQQYLVERGEDQKRLLLQALGCSSDPQVLQKLQMTAIRPGPGGVTKEDGFILLQKIAGNSVGRLPLYWFLRNNFDELVEYYGSVRIISTLLSTISQYWNTESQLRLVGELVNEFSGKLQPVMRSINSTTLNIRGNIDWMGAYGESIQLWLANQHVNSS